MEKERNWGVDVLRMFSMLLVVILHVLGQGGVLFSGSLAWQSASYYTAWTLETMAFCAVNCYALISGFVMYGHKCSVGKLLSTWLPVFFWSVLLSFVVWGMYPESRTLDFVVQRAFLPVIFSQYWYMTAYFLLYLLMPALLAAMEHLSFVPYTGVVLGTLVFGTVGSFFGVDPFVSGAGYSVIWLILCFLWGGYLRKFHILEHVRAWWGAVLFAVCVAAVVLFKYITENYFLPVGALGNAWLSYISPFIVFAAVGLLVLFARMPVHRLVRPVIKFLSPAALGVYLIHTHQLVFFYIVGGFAASFATFSAPLLALAVVGSAIGIYLACTALELVRIYLFRLIRVPQLCKLVDRWIARLVDYLEKRFAHKTTAEETQDVHTASN